MMYKHGKEYGSGVPWAERGEGRYYFLVEKGLLPVEFDIPPYILVYFKVNIFDYDNDKICKDFLYNSGLILTMNHLETRRSFGLKE